MKPPDRPSHSSLGDLGRRAHRLASQVSARASDAATQVSQHIADQVPQRLRPLAPGASARGRPEGTGTEGTDAPAPGEGAVPGTSSASPVSSASSPSRSASHPTSVPQPPRITGTPFARTLATALGSRPHSLSAGTRLFGSSPPRHLLRLGPRLHDQILRRGYASTPDCGTNEDAEVLGYVHGALLMSLQGWPRSTGQRQRALPRLLPTRLSQVEIPADQARAGGLPWRRLCVDTDRSERLLEVFSERHLDVLIAPVGREPSEYAADLRLLLPQGLPAEVAAALQAAPQGRTVRLHLLDEDRVAVDLAEKTVTVFDGVAHHGVASLTVTDGRVERAEVWLGRRRSWPLLSALEWLPPS